MLIDPNFVRRTSSLLGRQHFQIAYVSNDFDRATDVLSERYGVREFHFIKDVPLPMGGKIDIALAWAGNINLEVIHGSGNRASFYERGLPEHDFSIAFHHFGYLIPDDQEWESLVATINATKRTIVHSGSDPSGLDFIYLDASDLGHYLEYIRPKKAWIDLFESLPRH